MIPLSSSIQEHDGKFHVAIPKAIVKMSGLSKGNKVYWTLEGCNFTPGVSDGK